MKWSGGAREKLKQPRRSAQNAVFFDPSLAAGTKRTSSGKTTRVKRVNTSELASISKWSQAAGLVTPSAAACASDTRHSPKPSPSVKILDSTGFHVVPSAASPSKSSPMREASLPQGHAPPTLAELSPLASSQTWEGPSQKFSKKLFPTLKPSTAEEQSYEDASEAQPSVEKTEVSSSTDPCQPDDDEERVYFSPGQEDFFGPDEPVPQTGDSSEVLFWDCGLPVEFAKGDGS